MGSELLEQVRVLDPVSGTDRVADIWIAEGKIREISPKIVDIPQETTVRDSRGLILAPGLVELYARSGEPGREERETLDSLRSAALAGGVTRIALLPDTIPPIDNPSVLERLRKKQPPNTALFYFWGAATQNLEGQQMTELAELSAAHCIGFTDGRPISNFGVLRQILEYLAPLGKPLALVATDRALRGEGVMREGVLSIRSGLPGDPAISEAAAIAALLEIIAVTHANVHLMRVSTARGVELIAEAKSRGLPITASVTWLHLLLSTEEMGSYDPNLRLDPPLGNPNDRAALIQGVREGTLDAIAIDHAPFTYAEKTVAFADAPCGAIGLELALPLLWHRFVETGEWSALTLWNRLSTAPLRCLQQPPLGCAVGESAELVLFDPHQTWNVNPQTLQSLSHNTYWLGKEIKGRAIQVWHPKNQK
ncbi:dihydroorotase [Lusitaniella coriacea]|uniref:dihydroorotase n=1 Tax=Lusitaniella coriacea TaxID=1983105 RepID=UPI003CEB778E